MVASPPVQSAGHFVSEQAAISAEDAAMESVFVEVHNEDWAMETLFPAWDPDRMAAAGAHEARDKPEGAFVAWEPVVPVGIQAVSDRGSSCRRGSAAAGRASRISEAGRKSLGSVVQFGRNSVGSMLYFGRNSMAEVLECRMSQVTMELGYTTHFHRNSLMEPEEVQTLKARSLRWVQNGMCFLVSLSSCASYAPITEFSQTAMIHRPGGDVVRTYPYDVFTMVMAWCAVSIFVSLFAIPLRGTPAAWRALVDFRLHLNMLPLAAVWVVTCIAPYFAIGAGGGPLSVAIGTSQVLFNAFAARLVMRCGHTWRQWCLIIFSIMAATWYSMGGSGLDSSLIDTACWSLAKATCSACALVLTEWNFKGKDLLVANFISAAQLLLLIGLLQLAIGDRMRPQLCDDVAGATPCIDRWGWDWMTVVVLLQMVLAGWIDVIMIVRMTATALALSRALVPAVLYVFYVLFMPGFSVTWQQASAVALLAVGLSCYGIDRVRAQDRDRQLSTSTDMAAPGRNKSEQDDAATCGRESVVSAVSAPATGALNE